MVLDNAKRQPRLEIKQTLAMDTRCALQPTLSRRHQTGSQAPVK